MFTRIIRRAFFLALIAAGLSQAEVGCAENEHVPENVHYHEHVHEHENDE